MRIGIDAHFIGKQETGNETYTLNLIRSLAVVDPEPNDYSLYLTNAEAAARPLVADSRFHNRLLKPTNPLVRIPFVFPWEVTRRPVDVLHTHYTVPPFLPKSTRTVVTIHDISWEYYPQFYNAKRLLHLKTTVPWSARRADRIVVASQSMKRSLIERYKVGAERIVVTPFAAASNFAPRERASCRERLLAKHGIEGHFILCVANLRPVKNLVRVLRAFAHLCKRQTIEAKLVIVGMARDGSGPFFSTLQKLKLEHDVILAGYVHQADLPDFYSAAEAFLFPSIFEAFGLPILEAMACGAPVITANRSACSEVAGGAALLVDPEDWEAIANAIQRVLWDARLREELRAAGLKRAREFSWQGTAAETLAIYQELAQGIQTKAAVSPLTAVSHPTRASRGEVVGHGELNEQPR